MFSVGQLDMLNKVKYVLVIPVILAILGGCSAPAAAPVAKPVDIIGPWKDKNMDSNGKPWGDRDFPTGRMVMRSVCSESQERQFR